MLALLGLVGSASAADYWFDHGSTPGDDLWSSAGNWNVNAVPTPTDNVRLYPNAGAGGTSDADIVLTYQDLQFNANNVTLNVLPGADIRSTQSTWFILGANAGQTHTVNVNGGDMWVTTPSGGLTIGDNGSGTLNVNSGNFVGVGGIALGWNKAGSSSHINVAGGLLYGTQNMTIRNTAVLDQSGGEVSLDSLGIDAGGLYTISEGTLTIRGKDDTANLTSLYGAGKIVLAPGSTIVDFSYDGTDTHLVMIPEPATLGMLALVGGGMLFIRKRFMI